MKLIKMKCDNCGASLKVDPSLDKITCNYCGTELFIDDKASELRRVEEVKLQARQLNHEQTLKEKQELEELKYKESFSKSKLKKFTIAFLVLAILLTMVAISNGNILTSIVGIIQIAVLVAALLTGTQTIKEPIKNFHKILAYTGIVLFFVFIRVGNIRTSENVCKEIDWNSIYYHEQLPKPSILKGDYNNSSYSTRITLCDTGLKDYNNYVDKIKEKGFSNIEKQEIDSYEATNDNNYKVEIRYSDYSKEITIYIGPVEEEKNNEK